MQDRMEIIVEVEKVGISEEEKLEWQERMIKVVKNATSSHEQCSQLGIEIRIVEDVSVGEIWYIKYPPKLNAFLNLLEIAQGCYLSPDAEERFLPNGDVLWICPCDAWSEKVFPFEILPRAEWEEIQRNFEEDELAAWEQICEEINME